MGMIVSLADVSTLLVRHGAKSDNPMFVESYLHDASPYRQRMTFSTLPEWTRGDYRSSIGLFLDENSAQILGISSPMDSMRHPDLPAQ